jgi:hypothetical protein
MAAMEALGACSVDGVVLLVIVETFAAIWATCNVMRSDGIKADDDCKTAVGPGPASKNRPPMHHLLLICDQTR